MVELLQKQHIFRKKLPSQVFRTALNFFPWELA